MKDTPTIHHPPASKDKHTLFKPGHNCWRIENALFASPIVDCSNYYRAVHEAICNARHTLFIVGWDIDSRIELIRGKNAEHSACPTTLSELLKWKSQVTPGIKMYLNRWNYSIFLASERESFASMKWKLKGIPNLEFVFDDQLPLGASHHQKIIVVDDEIAFCGGMDIAIARWDNRQHHVNEARRRDPNGTLLLGLEKEYRPYHDAQMLVTGEIVKSLGELVRKRWHFSTGKHAADLNFQAIHELPPSWPQSVTPFFQNVRMGIALTTPRFREQSLDRTIERLYLDLIKQADRFIYMENQFFTHVGIAQAINKRLKENPRLRVLMLSCKDPQGFMEKKTMYYGRAHFKEALVQGGVKDRVVLAFPISKENSQHEQIRIHSKVIIVDEQYLRIGSSNLNYRSMTLDTECDLVIEATDSQSQQNIASIRNDLIREHTGRKVKDIERIIFNGSVREFLKDIPYSRQHIREINDARYKREKFAKFFIRFGDPSKPLLPSHLTSGKHLLRKVKHLFDNAIPFKLLATALAIIALILVWKITPLSEYADIDKLVTLLDQFRNSAWGLPVGILAYALGTLLFLPHVVMTSAVILTFAPVLAFLVAMAGSLLSCTIGFGIGRMLGEDSMKALFGKYSDKIRKLADKGGILGLTALRLVPTAPFTVTNIILGMIRVPYWTFIISTFLALLPGTLLFVWLGHAALELFRHPDPQKYTFTAIGILAWITLLWLTHHITTRWKKKARG